MCKNFECYTGGQKVSKLYFHVYFTNQLTYLGLFYVCIDAFLANKFNTSFLG